MTKALQKRIDEMKAPIEELKSELEEKFDNSSDTWKESESGELCLENIDACQRALDALDDLS